MKLAIALTTMAGLTVLSGCSTLAEKGIVLRTPYGVVDTTTSGPGTSIDISPLFPPPPPPVPKTLEK